MTSIIRPLLAFLLTVTFVGCATTGGSGSGTPYPALEAEFIPDRRPLRSSTDLLAFAETLPIYNAGDPKGWVRPIPTPGINDGEWLMRTNGAVNPVRIQRLSRAGSGAQRIKVLVGPSRNSKINPPPVWVYELERTKGGWKQSF
ncbi:MAG: hypothetical protein AAGB14_07730 [Verrucomicrobiota bacterium]